MLDVITSLTLLYFDISSLVFLLKLQKAITWLFGSAAGSSSSLQSYAHTPVFPNLLHDQ